MPNSVAYCTIASANYMTHVMGLRDSLARHHGASLNVLFCEPPDLVREQIAPTVEVQCHTLDDIGCDEWLRMAFRYDITEFNTAVKPFLLRTLLNRGADAVVYFDPDIVIFNDLRELEALALTHDAVLTPHICSPFEEDGHFPDSLELNRRGQFNLGFCALRKGEQVDGALRWWEGRCRRECVFDPEHALFVDQGWANLMVSFLPDVHILRSEAYNMAWWNLFQRRLYSENGRWMTGDGPLVFFHYSGLQPDRLNWVSRHSTGRCMASAGSDLYRLLEDYTEQMKASCYRSFSSYPYVFDRFEDGTPVTREQRQKYLRLTDIECNLVGNPFCNRTYIDSLVEIGEAADTSSGSQAPATSPSITRADLPLRYKVVDKVNDSVKRLPLLHSLAKALMNAVVAARVRLRGAR
jgi:hypothetical protein